MPEGPIGKIGVTVSPADPDRVWAIVEANEGGMINGNDGGGNVSINGGETWTEQDYVTTQLYHVMATSDVPYPVCGAQQDNSTVCVPSDGWGNMLARGPGHGWYYAVGGGESGWISHIRTTPSCSTRAVRAR